MRKWMSRGAVVFAGLFFVQVAISSPQPMVPTTVTEQTVPAMVPFSHEAPPIQLAGKAWVLMDFNSGEVLSEKNPNKRIAPASLVKVMTYYVVAEAVETGKIKLSDKVHISKKAWKAEGSRMFVKVNSSVTVENLLRGMVIQSGNDAAIALAEYVAGDEASFAVLMNRAAKKLGMNQSHFENATGLTDGKTYTTVYDMALLVKALIRNYPREYQLYSQKWFTWNGIKQPNRNRLLWRMPGVDGVKTGYTREAGYNLIASAKKGDMRLISVMVGAKNEHLRISQSQKLLTYGFRFFESKLLYPAAFAVVSPRVWLGTQQKVNLGIKKPLYVAIPYGDAKKLKATVDVPKDLKAPIANGHRYGTLRVFLSGQEIAKRPLVALDAVPEGSLWVRMIDRMNLFFNHVFGDDQA